MAFVLQITSKATQCLREVIRNVFVHVLCVVKLETLQLRGYSRGDYVTEKLQSPGDSYSSSLEPMCVVLVKEIVQVDRDGQVQGMVPPTSWDKTLNPFSHLLLAIFWRQ